VKWLLVAFAFMAGLNIVRMVIWYYAFYQPIDWLLVGLDVIVIIGVPTLLWRQRET